MYISLGYCFIMTNMFLWWLSFRLLFWTKRQFFLLWELNKLEIFLWPGAMQTLLTKLQKKVETLPYCILIDAKAIGFCLFMIYVVYKLEKKWLTCFHMCIAARIVQHQELALLCKVWWLTTSNLGISILGDMVLGPYIQVTRSKGPLARLQQYTCFSFWILILYINLCAILFKA